MIKRRLMVELTGNRDHKNSLCILINCSVFTAFSKAKILADRRVFRLMRISIDRFGIRKGLRDDIQ